MENLSLLGIIIGLTVLVVLALRGWHILIIAPLAAVIVLIMSGKSVPAGLNGPYMDGFIGFAKNLFFIFWGGSVFAKVMEHSGAAESIAIAILKLTGTAKSIYVIIALVVATALLTYGGVTVWVVVFAIAPIARSLFKDADISWHFFPGILVFGSWTATMTMLPGTPQVHNIIPTKYLGTNTMAAPTLGIAASIVCLAAGLLYFYWVVNKSKEKGIGYPGTDPQGDKITEKKEKLPNIIISVIPSAALLFCMNTIKMDPFMSFCVGIASGFILLWKYLEKPLKTAIDGAVGCAIPLINTCADVGFGKVVASVAGFGVVEAFLHHLGNGYISIAVATNIMVGITGSASGGLGIVMEIFSKQWLASGLNPEAIHRIAAIAAGGFDTMPHNGAVITLLAVVGLTHKEAYKHMFVSSVICPILGLCAAIPLAILIY
jgi:H+/gluconate symporter-like permease